MHFHFRNVNDAFYNLVGYMNEEAKGLSKSSNIARRSSRNGNTLYFIDPCTITYKNPLERVLFSPARDANPFFHFIEAMWMLAGRNDLETLVWYNKSYANFSDDSKHVNGAYGHRWRHYFGLDQLDIAIQILNRDRSTRRVVIQHWSPRDLELCLKQPGNRDVPCNTQVLFQVREATVNSRDAAETPESPGSNETTESVPMYLDMSVFNRSNDLIWGTLGANFVHFSFLHEYMALATNLMVGKYHQISANQHVYLPPDPNTFYSKTGRTDRGRPEGGDVIKTNPMPTDPAPVLASNLWQPEKWLADGLVDYYSQPHNQLLPSNGVRTVLALPTYPAIPVTQPEPYAAITLGGEDVKSNPRRYISSGFPFHPNKHKAYNWYPLFYGYSLELFNEQLQQFMHHPAHGPLPHTDRRSFKIPFLHQIAEPLRLAWQMHKARNYSHAKVHATSIVAPDWRWACLEWLDRAEARFGSKPVVSAP